MFTSEGKSYSKCHNMFTWQLPGFTSWGWIKAESTPVERPYLEPLNAPTVFPVQNPSPQKKKEQLHSVVPKWFHLRPSWFRLGLFFQTNMGGRDQYCGMSIELPQNGSIFQLRGPKVQPGNKHPINGIPFAIIGHHIVVRNHQEMYIQQTSH